MSLVYRDRLQIIRKVLRILTEYKGIISTVERYANLSHQSAEKYLELLYKNDCLYKIDNGKYNNYTSYEYKMTTKGFELLKVFDEFFDKIGNFDF